MTIIVRGLIDSKLVTRGYTPAVVVAVTAYPDPFGATSDVVTTDPDPFGATSKLMGS